jgi:membrane associated rhomboid family serine protease
LEAYRRENRHWAWRKQVLKGGLLFDWTSILWVLLLVTFYAMADGQPALKDRGLMNSTAVYQGEFWRLFTAVWLHADLGHLASNAALGIVLLGLAMGRYGSGIGLLAAYLAGMGGNVVVWALSLGHSSLGASGMVMGCLGMLAASTFYWHRVKRMPFKSQARGVFAGILLFVLLGLSPDTDFRAHIGGFLTGLILGLILNYFPGAARSGKVRLAAALIFTGLVIVPWGLAFRATH